MSLNLEINEAKPDAKNECKLNDKKEAKLDAKMYGKPFVLFRNVV